MKFLIKFPTRQRPERFKETLDNIISTIGEVDFKFLVTLDLNDETMQTDDIRLILDKIPHRYGISHNKIDAVNRDMAISGEWDILVQVSDDMRFVESNWGQRIIDDINNDFKGSLDCYLHYHDADILEKICTMQIMGRTYFERTGTIYNPIYKTIYCDAEATFVAQMLCRYKFYNKVLFRHQHPANGFEAPKADVLYDRNNIGADEDQRIYESRRKQNFYVNNPHVIPIDLLPYQQRAIS